MPLSSADRAVVAAMWGFRARSENQAAARFERIAARLTERPALQALALESVEDERRHRARCAGLAERFGHAPLAAELVEVPVPELGRRTLSPERRLSYEVVAFCCLTESINAALLTRSYAETTDPDSRAAVREILADEVQHARLGWAYLAQLDDRRWLAEQLVRMLEATVPEELRDPRIQPDPSPALREHGVFPRSELRGLLRECVDAVIVPGLTLLGVDASTVPPWMAAIVPE